MVSKKTNIITGVLALLTVFSIIYGYVEDKSVYLPNVFSFYGPGVIYFVIALCSLFTILGFHSFYLAWKKHRKSKNQPTKEEVEYEQNKNTHENF